MLQITAELKRVLKKSGVMFINWGDCYGGSGCGKGDYRNNNKRSISNPNLYCEKPNPQLKLTPKCLALQNFRAIIRMIDEQNWILRNTIIWHKPNHMPSSVKDRFANAYEPVFMLVKSKKYWFDLDAVRVPHSRNWGEEGWAKRIKKDGMSPKYKNLHRHGGNKTLAETYNPLGKNPGDIFTIPTQGFKDAHFATFPEKLVETLIKSGCPQWICKKCGFARERITNKGKIISEGGSNNGKWAHSNDKNIQGKKMIAREIITAGWTDCSCPDDGDKWRSGIVLDPFVGSGTTAKMAIILGRNYIGSEISKEYCEIAEKRIRKEKLQKRLAIVY